MRTSLSLLLTLAPVALLASGLARADPATETRLREALRTTTTQLRALEDERTKWQASEAALRGELQTLRKQAASARPSPAKPNPREVAELNRRITEQAAAAAKLTESLAKCQAASQEAAQAARAKGEEERARQSSEASALGARLAASEARSRRIYAVGKELITWFEGEDVGTWCEERAPLLGLKRVQLENIAQDFEDKLLEARGKPGGAP